MQHYTYLGDRYTDMRLKGARCSAVHRAGKCVRGRNGNMLVRFATGEHVVLARLLRKIKL